ncbi:MAG: transposase [Armatimonadetes bacterium]|nr:transposase [Armatimonadota bacterium]
MILDGTGLPRKGTASVGVARPYGNQTGKIDNCQVALLAVYASEKRHARLDRQLYVPSVWFGEDYAPLRERCDIPEEVGFQTQLM